MNTIKLWNGVEMPQIGYGVYQVTPEECERCVTEALEVGYRMIDTTQARASSSTITTERLRRCSWDGSRTQETNF